jgi:hypothetical protein
MPGITMCAAPGDRKRDEFDSILNRQPISTSRGLLERRATHQMLPKGKASSAQFTTNGALS